MQRRKSHRHQIAAQARWRAAEWRAEDEREAGIPDRAFHDVRRPIPLPLARLGWHDVTLEPRLGYIAWRCRNDDTGEVLRCCAFGEMLRWIAGQVPRQLGARNLQ